MAGEFTKFTRRARDGMQLFNTPEYKQRAEAEDTSRANVQELQQALRDRRHQSPMQQQVLGAELERIKALQTRQLQQAAQAMPQQLMQSLSPASTGEPWPPPENAMIKLILQMQRRHPGRYGPATQVPY